MRAGVAAICLALWACRLPDLIGGGGSGYHMADTTYRVGTPLRSDVHAFDWAPDGRTLYAATWSSGLLALDLATDSARVLDDLGSATVEVVPGPSAHDIYYVRFWPSREVATRRQLVRVSSAPGSPVTLLVDSVPPDFCCLTVSGDGAWAALYSAQTTIWNLGTGASSQVPDGMPVAFGTAGRLALLSTHDACRVFALDAGTNATISQPWLADPFCVRGGVRWIGDSLAGVGIFGRDLPTRGDTLYAAGGPGSLRAIYVLPFDDAVTSLTWSADGSKLAIWYDACGTLGFLLCATDSYKSLYVLDVASGVAQRIAGGRGVNGAASFSPDGRRIAYWFNSTLYVDAVP